MRSPFYPGMDPWLEHVASWQGVRNTLVANIARDLGPRLRPRYLVRPEERTYQADPDDLVFVGRPDVSIVEGHPGPAVPAGQRTVGQPCTVFLPVPDVIREVYLEVRTVPDGKVVTVLELLSPTNKRPGEGRELYLEKRRHALSSATHLVEVDLLRDWERMPIQGDMAPHDYHILVSPSASRPRALLYAWDLPDPVPRFRIPLLAGDPEPELDLGRAIHETYEQLGFDLSLDYRQEPIPPLPDARRAWADLLLGQAGLR